MKQRVFPLVAYTMVALVAGCARPCFYQAGKSLVECRADLLECLRSPAPEVCMQSKGYHCLYLRKGPGGRKRIKIATPVGEYWVLDGLGMPPDRPSVSSAPEPPTDDPKEESPGRIVEYRIERGELGTFEVTLVYEDGEHE